MPILGFKVIVPKSLIHWTNTQIMLQTLIGLTLVSYALYISVHFNSLPSEMSVSKYSSLPLAAGVAILMLSFLTFFLKRPNFINRFFGKIVILAIILLATLAIFLMATVIVTLTRYDDQLTVALRQHTYSGYESPNSSLNDIINTVALFLNLDSPMRSVVPALYTNSFSNGLFLAYSSCCDSKTSITPSESCRFMVGSPIKCDRIDSFSLSVAPSITSNIYAFVVTISILLLVYIAISLPYLVFFFCGCSMERKYNKEEKSLNADIEVVVNAVSNDCVLCGRVLADGSCAACGVKKEVVDTANVLPIAA